MRIHRAGFKIIGILFLSLLALNLLVSFLTGILWLRLSVLIPSFLILLFVLRFFRISNRVYITSDKQVIAPADGKIVVVEECVEEEYFHDKRIQVSIFMSVWNVHINWYSISGVVKYFKYHPGLFLYAWLPKSSTDNERTTLVVETPAKTEILFRQIAGAVARRIETYAQVGATVSQCQEMGFIKFGSRVDVFLPIGTKIIVQPGQKSIGGQTIIADLA